MGLLRLLLALAVVITHTHPIFGFWLTGGKVSVQAFFIISGFYMSMILNEKYVGENNSYWLFISNRLMRLLPVYWVVLLLTAGCVLWVSPFYGFRPYLDAFIVHFNNMNFFAFAYLVLTNLFLLGQDVVMFLGLDTETGKLFFTKDFRGTNPQLYTFLFVPQAWTIGLELAFYLLAPFLLRRKLSLIVLLILLSLALRIFLYRLGLNHDPWTYRFFPTELAFFLLGNLSYHLYKRLNKVAIKPPLALSALLYMLSFTLFFSFLPPWFEQSAFFLPFKVKESLYFASLAVLLPVIFRLSRHWRLDRSIGELSYPVYISHLLVLLVVNVLVVLADQKLHMSLKEWRGPIVMGVTLLLSLALNEWVAKKVEVMRQGRLQPAAAPAG